MQLARFASHERPCWGALSGGTVTVAAGDPYGDFKLTDDTLPLAGVTLLAPCTPSKIVCIGLNYSDHARELGMGLPEEPVMFLKPSTSLNHPGGIIDYPSLTHSLHYEAELAVVLKKTARNVPEAKAREYILGYTCANDVTARDLQKKDGQWTRSKSFDSFMPIGPWVETEVDPDNLAIRLFLNGQERQSSSTRNLVFKVDSLVARISQVMTLLPGDVIITGTPSGVGPMEPGDTVTVVIEGIGRLENTVGKP